MKVIDMQRLRDALPKRAILALKWKTDFDNTRTLYLECIVRWPGLCPKGTKEEDETWEEVKQWQREIIGAENISEFYALETGSHWRVYLKRVPLEFINCTDEDIKTYSGFSIKQLTSKPPQP